MKRIFGAKSKLLVSLLALICIMAVGGTMAYLFAKTDPVTNSFSGADLNTELHEEGKTAADKTVTVSNTGESPAWVRARLLVSGIDPKNVVILTSDHGRVQNNQIGLVMPASEWQVKIGDNWKAPNSEGVNYSNFADEWIYYTTPLAGKTDIKIDSTDELLDGVVFGSAVNAENISITVIHESVLALDTKDAPDGTKAWKYAFDHPAGNTSAS